MVFQCFIQQYVTEAAKWKYWLLVTENFMQLLLPSVLYLRITSHVLHGRKQWMDLTSVDMALCTVYPNPWD